MEDEIKENLLDIIGVIKIIINECPYYNKFFYDDKTVLYSLDWILFNFTKKQIFLFSLLEKYKYCESSLVSTHFTEKSKVLVIISTI